MLGVILLCAANGSSCPSLMCVFMPVWIPGNTTLEYFLIWCVILVTECFVVVWHGVVLLPRT